MRIEIDPKRPNSRLLKKTAETIREGGVAIIPTDTRISFACSIQSKKAMSRLHLLKNINPKKPLTFLGRDLPQIQRYVHALPQPAFRLLKNNVPSKNTFIFKASKLTPQRLLTPRKEIGIRIPDASVVSGVLEGLDDMILVAGITQEDEGNPVQESDAIYARFGRLVDVTVDAGDFPVSQSSILDLTSGRPVLVRQGDSDTSPFV